MLDFLFNWYGSSGLLNLVRTKGMQQVIYILMDRADKFWAPYSLLDATKDMVLQ